MTAPLTGTRVVFLTFHYPPSLEVGAIRAARIVRALAQAGARVTVIRAAAPEARQASDPELPGVEVRSVTPAVTPAEWYHRLKARLRRKAPPAVESAGPAWTPPATVGALKRLALSLMWLPDPRQGFIWPAARAAVSAIRRSGPRTILYSSSPPASSQVAALLAQAWTGAPWILEMRDPWVDNPGKPWYCRTAFSDGVERRLERRCLARATRVVAVSDGIARLVSAKLRDPAKVIVVRNGIDPVAVPPCGPVAGPLRIVHAGTCYLGRDPRPFLRALAAVAHGRGLGPSDVQVELIGSCEWFDGVSVRGAARDLGIDELVTFAGWVPHAEAQQRIANADLLLLLAEGQPDQVPNKLYDYLGSRRRMLVFADPGGETARMARAAGGHVVTHAADPELERRVEAALDAPRAGPVGDERLLHEWSAERQMNRLVEAITELQLPA